MILVRALAIAPNPLRFMVQAVRVPVEARGDGGGGAADSHVLDVGEAIHGFENANQQPGGTQVRGKPLCLHVASQ